MCTVSSSVSDSPWHRSGDDVSACCAEAAAKLAREPCNLHPPTAQPVDERYRLLPIYMTREGFRMVESSLGSNATDPATEEDGFDMQRIIIVEAQ